MNPIIVKFLSSYLLMPILAVVLGVLVMFIAKKNKLLSNTKVIFYFLLTWILLALPALLGFINFWFMPYFYVALLVLYLSLGYFNLGILYRKVPAMEGKPYWVEFLIVFVSFLIGAGIFSLIFNLCNELQYGIWASTCIFPFILPSIFRKMYQTFMSIPLEVYEIWQYDKDVRIEKEHIDTTKILVVELELFKKVEDDKPFNVKAKAPETMNFGNWFQLFIEDYSQKHPESPIIFTDATESYGWLFYTNSFFLGIRRHIDPKLTFAENKIKEKNIILAKRARQQGDENNLERNSMGNRKQVDEIYSELKQNKN